MIFFSDLLIKDIGPLSRFESIKIGYLAVPLTIFVSLGLINAFNLLPVGGIIVVVSFHSIEDKIVKFFFKNYSEIKNSSRYSPVEVNNIKCFNLKN